LTFPEKGNEAAGVKSSDLIFRIKEIPHSQYKRKGNDLVYISKINLVEALTAESVTVQTLDGRKIFISLDEIVSPNTLKVVKGEGMPIYNKDEFKVENFGKELPKGDLYIKFDIAFPSHIDDYKK
jgi:DnaJ family protein B protein 13